MLDLQIGCWSALVKSIVLYGESNLSWSKGSEVRMCAVAVLMVGVLGRLVKSVTLAKICEDSRIVCLSVCFCE